MAKLLRKRGNEVFLGMINEAELVEVQELSMKTEDRSFHITEV